MRALPWIACVSLSVGALLPLPGFSSASESTTAVRLRAAVGPERLREIRREMSALRAENRWPNAQQDRYLEVCLKERATEPSLNRRTCECELEVMMDRYQTLGDLVNDLMTKGSSDERTSGLVGLCLASFGS